MNPDFFISILFNAHVTSTFNNPICMNTYKLQNIDKTSQLIKRIREDERFNNQNIIEKIVEKAFGKFKQSNYGNLRGSVHIDPVLWCKIVLDFIHDNINKLDNVKEKNDLEINIPNGCCNKNDCPIKIYYEYVMDEINNTNFV